MSTVLELTDDELKAELARREKAKQKEQRDLENQHEQRKEKFLQDAVGRFEKHRKELKELKQFVITEANAIWNEMYEIQGQKPKKQKQISIKKGDYKITAERREKFEFTDEAIVHIDKIKEIMKNKFEIKNKGMYAFLDAILMKNGKGDYDPKLLAKAKAKAKQLGYDELIEELDKLSDCQQVTGTALYCRAYKRNKNGAYKDVVIQFSAL